MIRRECEIKLIAMKQECDERLVVAGTMLAEVEAERDWARKALTLKRKTAASGRLSPWADMVITPDMVMKTAPHCIEDEIDENADGSTKPTASERLHQQMKRRFN
jgi:hypothetical protein